MQANIDDWVSSIKKELIIPIEKSTKAIDYPEYGYSITGYFKKGVWEYGEDKNRNEHGKDDSPDKWEY